MTPAELRKILRELEMTQEEFAKKSGISQASISRWASGRIRIHQIFGQHLRRVAEELAEKKAS